MNGISILPCEPMEPLGLWFRHAWVGVGCGAHHKNGLTQVLLSVEKTYGTRANSFPINNFSMERLPIPVLAQDKREHGFRPAEHEPQPLIARARGAGVEVDDVEAGARAPATVERSP
jgi:hypothetical protein